MVFKIQPLPADDASRPVRQLSDPRQTDELRAGDLVQAWDHLFQWTEHSLPHSELNRYAQLADPPVDAFLASLPPGALAHQDTLVALAAAAEKGEASAFACWEEVCREPPESVRVTEDEWAEGSTYFWDHAGLIFTSLLHFSLAGGFSAPRITRHLHAASYLIPPVDKTGRTYCPISDASRDRTRGRLAETGQYVLDVMGCPVMLPDTATEKEKAYVANRLSLGIASLRPPPRGSFTLANTGEAWQASTRVRLLHGVARHRVAQRLAKRKGSATPRKGDEDVALNQEDMIGTLASFAVAPLWCLERLGASKPVLSEADELDGRRSYIRLWRHIGFYLGIPVDVLESHFSSFLPANSLLASIVVDLFPPSGRAPPSPASAHADQAGADDDAGRQCPFDGPHPDLPPPTLPVLQAIAGQPPVATSLEHHQALTRALIGDELGDYLGLDRGGWVSRVKLKASVLLLVYPSWFAAIYPSERWRALRRSVIREALGRMMKMQAGGRRSLYRPREDGVLSAEALELEKLSLDPEGARRLGKRYWAMVGEMAGVTVAVGTVGAWCAVSAFRTVLAAVF